jgi:hypothetical protein
MTGWGSFGMTAVCHPPVGGGGQPCRVAVMSAVKGLVHDPRGVRDEALTLGNLQQQTAAATNRLITSLSIRTRQQLAARCLGGAVANRVVRHEPGHLSIYANPSGR